MTITTSLHRNGFILAYIELPLLTVCVLFFFYSYMYIIFFINQYKAFGLIFQHYARSSCGQQNHLFMPSIAFGSTTKDWFAHAVRIICMSYVPGGSPLWNAKMKNVISLGYILVLISFRNGENWIKRSAKSGPLFQKSGFASGCRSSKCIIWE